MQGTVLRRAKGQDRKPMGTHNPNPRLDTRSYTVPLSDGCHREFAANIIAENLYAQVDEDGIEHLFIQEITGHHHNQDYDAHVPNKAGSN